MFQPIPLFKRLMLPLVAASLMVVQLQPGLQAAPDQTAAFRKLVDQYFDAYFRNNPSSATYAGIHAYDGQPDDYSKAGVAADIAFNQKYLKAFTAIDPKGLSQADGIDRELLIGTLKASLLEEQVVKHWERDPDHYSSGVSSSIFTLMSRNFAPADVRLRALIAREKAMPKVFADARANLKNPPKEYTQVAIDQLPDTIAFFQNDVPAAFASVKDSALQAQFKASNAALINAMQGYEAWLRTYLLPRSKGDYRLGAEIFRKKLLYEEMVDLPLDKLLEIGYADIKRNQDRFKATAAALDAKATPDQILTALTHEHPAPDKLLQSFRDVLGGLKQYIQEHHIITIPSPVLPLVEETPPFERALIFASMDTPGPFETKAKEAYFNVTLPEKDWKASEIEEHMEGFNYGTIISTAVHEAYPGHYIQFLWAQRVPDKVRKMLGASSNSEGWAHYCEQMMLDEGYGKGDLKLRLGQLQDALLRNARFIVGIKLHTGQMTFQQGVDYFVKEGYQSRTNAERETMRGTNDPTYLYYTLGKLEIMKLRADYQKLKGKDFSLQDFHDRFMKEGFPPIKLVRRAMLGKDGPVL